MALDREGEGKEKKEAVNKEEPARGVLGRERVCGRFFSPLSVTAAGAPYPR